MNLREQFERETGKIAMLDLRRPEPTFEYFQWLEKKVESRVSGTEYTAMDWLERGVRGAIPRGAQDGVPITECPRWVAVRDGFVCGSRYAVALCEVFELDPDETVKRVKR